MLKLLPFSFEKGHPALKLVGEMGCKRKISQGCILHQRVPMAFRNLLTLLSLLWKGYPLTGLLKPLKPNLRLFTVSHEAHGRDCKTEELETRKAIPRKRPLCLDRSLVAKKVHWEKSKNRARQITP